MSLVCEDVSATQRRPRYSRAAGFCRWCKSAKSARRSTAVYCSDQCRIDHHNYVKTQGASVISIAKRWRRYKGKGDFSLFTRLLDDLIAEDKAKGINFYPDPPTEAFARPIKSIKRS